MNIKAWLMQPTTILGLGSAAGTIAGLIVHAMTHDTTWAVAAGSAAFALVHVAIPENTGAQSSIEKLVTDAVTAAAQKKLAAALPVLIQDGLAVVGSFSTPATTTTTVSTTTTPPPGPV